MESTQPAQLPDDVLQQLEEKDQLIQTLTERLSEVAEQLDRARRSGGDRGARSSGPSGEVVEQQRQLLEALSTVVEQWEDVQPRSAFNRIEARLDHMRALLESAVESGLTPGSISTRTMGSLAGDVSHQGDAPDGDEESEEQPLSGWEAMKAQLLSGVTPPSPPPSQPATSETEPPDSEAASPTNAAESSSAAAADPVNLGEHVKFPEPVDFDSAKREDLEQAIEVRDAFIGLLARRLRSEQQRTRQAINWEALNNAPDELRERLQALEADLVDRLRVAEVELSLERARLSRVQSRIGEMQQQVEMRLRAKRAQDASDASPGGKGSPEPASAGAKGWFKSLRR